MHIHFLPSLSKHLLRLPAVYEALCWVQEGGFERLGSPFSPFDPVNKVMWPGTADFASETEKTRNGNTGSPSWVHH